MDWVTVYETSGQETPDVEIRDLSTLVFDAALNDTVPLQAMILEEKKSFQLMTLGDGRTPLFEDEVVKMEA